MIPYGRQHIDDDDIAAVVDVLESDWLTQGPRIGAFEADVRSVTGARHAVAFSSGTAALHGAVHAAGLGPGDLVATSPLSFAASANCALYEGADVSFVDIDPTTLNLDPTRISPDATGLVAVHFAGLPIDLASIPHRPRVVIEDAAHALGAFTPSGPVGNCAHSDLCCFSFHPVKTITTGEGGMVTTNSDELAERLRAFRHHGIRATPEDGGWTYDISDLGYNYRLTDLQAALGISQLHKLDWFIDRRNDVAETYRTALRDVATLVLPPPAPPGFRHANHLFPVRVPRRAQVYEEMRARGIGVQVHYIPTYRLSAYARRGFVVSDHPATEEAYSGLLSLPIFPDLTPAEQETVIDTLVDVLQ